MKFVGRVARADVADGKLVRLAYPPYDVLVGEVDGAPYAIEDACNHAGASLGEGSRVNEEGESSDRGACIACPMHGYVFDLRTGALVLPLGLCDDQRRFLAMEESDEIVIWDPFEIRIA